MRTRFAGLAGIPLLTIATALGAPAEAARISLIRDAEIENTIATYTAPLFAAVGLDAAAVSVHLVKDRRLNAFVAGGMNLFVNTGLLLSAKSPNEVIGVIAHESGHIAAGHLARTEEALRGASKMAILAYVLGAAAIIAGAGEGATALIVGGQQVAQQSFLRYTRSQEQAADQFAVSALERTGQSARGLLTILEKLADQEVLATSRQDPYVRSHPLTRDRIRFVRNHVAGSAYSEASLSPADDERFRRMRGKLRGFLDPPERTFARYPKSDTSMEARYARAVAHHRRANLRDALGEIDSLIAERANDPYFHELRGQMLFENGRVREAVDSYRRAAELLPDAPLIRVGLAQAMIETGDQASLADAAGHLDAAVRLDREDAKAWRLLSIVHGRTGKTALSTLASAERALLVGRYADAVGFAKRAGQQLAYGSPGRLRAEDIERAAKDALKKAEKKKRKK